jgi:copper chaperone
METATISISGMSCGHCVSAVRKALGAVPGVVVEDVTVGSATVSVDTAHRSLTAVETAINAAGFDVVKGRVLNVSAAPTHDHSSNA